MEYTAYGHANPVSYSPSANAVIINQQQENGSLPDKVGIFFSERPEPKLSTFMQQIQKMRE
jgi:hypothetical protein